MDGEWTGLPGGEFVSGLTPGDAEALARINVEVSARHLEDDPDRWAWGADRAIFRDRTGNLDFLIPLLTALCPVRTIALRPYRIARRPVTCGQFAEFCRASGQKWYPPLHSRPEDVATGVRFQDAVRYARWIDARLPTVDEWERAARGISRRLFPWGPVWIPAADTTMDTGFGAPGPAGKTPGLETPDGIFGLVSGCGEWCEGSYDPDPDAWSRLRERPKGELGGDWPVVMGRRTLFIPNAVVRKGYEPDEGGFLPGFRLACDVDSRE